MQSISYLLIAEDTCDVGEKRYSWRKGPRVDVNCADRALTDVPSGLVDLNRRAAIIAL